MIRIAKEELTERLKKQSPAEIASDFGCHVATIHIKMKRFGITRSRHAHLINESFFSEWGYDMAYILGFTLADGSVNQSLHHNQLQFQIQAKDIEILNFIRSCIQPSSSIFQYSRINISGSQSNVVHVVFSSKKILENLAFYGYVPNKTYTELRLPNIPSKFLGDFIRGVFDGDGCITRTMDGKKILANISCNSSKFLEDIRDIIGFGHVSYNDKPPRLMFSSRSDMKKFYDLIYGNDLGFRLMRKYDKFKEIIDG